MEYVDMYYVDIKSMDPAIYKAYTGGNLQIAIDNLQYLLNKVGEEKVVIRIPNIPGLTNGRDQEQSKAKLKVFGAKKFDLFSYVKTDRTRL